MEKELADEARIYEEIKGLVIREIKALKLVTALDFTDVKRLEVLTKIYASLKDDLRSDLRSGILGTT